MKLYLFSAFALGFLFPMACSDGTTNAGGPQDASAGSEDGAEIPPGAVDIVINEFNPSGSNEWIEIGNKGTTSFDLSEFLLADSDKTTGAPKTNDAMKFPSGTVLAPDARLVVLVSKKDQPVGPHPKADCLPQGPDTCLFATWGISASNGESVHFLTKDGTVISSTSYTRNLGVDADAGQTACRLPDLTGEFVMCRGTPGGENAAP